MDEIMKRLVIATLIATLVGGIFTTPASAAYTVKPRVGQCFLYSVADVDAPYARKNPVSCSSTHNAETYLVTKWPLKMKPSEMPDEEALSLADSLCRAWGKTNLENRVTSCWGCNYGKYNALLEQMGLDDPRERPIEALTDWNGLR